MKNKHIAIFSIVLIVGLVAGFGLGSSFSLSARAQTDTVVDEGLLAKLYDLAFHRPLDNEALGFHGGKALDAVLNDIIGSEEHRAYSGLYKATKAYEEARRAPGDVGAADDDAYLDIIDSALSHVRSWADTLPEQAIENRVIGPEEARTAIQKVYDSLNATAQQNAERGLFQALEVIGQPSALALPLDVPFVQ